MADIAQLGIQVTAKGVDESSRALDKLTAAAERAAKATDAFASNAGRIRTATGQAAQGFEGASKAVSLFQAFLGGLIGGTVVAATQSLVGLAGAIGKVGGEAIALAMESQRMGIAVQVVGKNVGWTSGQIATMAQALERANIPTSKADENLVRLAASGLTASQSQQLLTAAMNLSVPAGIGVSEALDRVTYAVATGNQRMLLSLRIHADFESSMDKMAQATAKDVEFLSDAEIAQARLNAILTAAAQYNDVYAQAQNTAATQTEALKVAWEGLLEEMGRDVLPTVTDGIVGLTDFLTGLRVVMEEVKATEMPSWMTSLEGTTNKAGAAANGLVQVNIFGWALDAVKGVNALTTPLGILYTLMLNISNLGKGQRAGGGAGGPPPMPGSINPLAPRVNAAGLPEPGGYYGTRVEATNKKLLEDVGAYVKTIGKAAGELNTIDSAVKKIHQKQKDLNATAEKYRATMADIAKKSPAEQQQFRTALAASMGVDVKDLPNVPELLRSAQVGAQRELAALAKRAAGPKGRHPRDIQDQNEEAIARATLAELKAREDLTHDVETVAEIKKMEAQTEFSSQKARLAQQVHDKTITAATAGIATAKYQEAMDEKIRLADLEKQQEADKRALDFAQQVAGYQERADRALADMAPTAAARATIEARALERRQASERDELDFDLKWKQTWGIITEAQAIRLRAELAAAQAAEAEAKARQDAVAVIRETYDTQLGMLAIQQTSLGYASAAAGSYREAADIARRILDLQFRERRLRDQEVIDTERAANAGADTARSMVAIADLAQTEVDQRNAMRAALGKATDIYNKISGNLGSLADAAKSHDWVRVFDLLEEAVSKYTEVMREGSGASTGQKAGAIGGLISGMGGALGVTGLKDLGGIIAVIGKLSDLMTGVAEKEKATAVTQESMSKGLSFLGGTGAGTFSGGVDRMVAGMDNLVSALNQAASGLGGGGTGGGPGIFMPGVNYNPAFNFTGTFNDVTRRFVQIANESRQVYSSLGQMNYGTQTTTGGLGNMTEVISGSPTGMGDGGAIGAVGGFTESLLSSAGSFASSLSGILSSVGGAMGGMGGGGLGGIGGMLGTVGGIAKGLSGGIGSMFSSFTSFMTVGLPVIGGIVSLIGGLFGDDDAEKNAEAQKRLAEAQRLSQQQMETLQKRQQLEIDLLRAMDKSEEALALERKLELAAMDESLKPLQEMVWSLNDLHETLDKAKTVLGRALERDLDAATRAVADAHQALVDSYESELQTVQDIASSIDDLLGPLTSFQKELETSPDLLGLSPAEAYKAARRGFDTANASTAEEAGRALLTASRAYYGSTAGYYKDVETVRKGIGMVVDGLRSQRDVAQEGIDWLNAIAKNQGLVDKELLPIGDAVEYLRSKIVLEDTARRQLETLDAQYNLGLIDHDINIAILDAVNRVAAAQEAYSGKVAEAQPLLGLGKTMTQWMAEGHEFDPILYLGMHPDVLAEAKHQLETADPASPSFTRIGLDKGIAGYAAWHWEHYGKAGGYQHGGSFKVRGSGAQDRFVPSWFAPNETVTVSRPGEIEAINKTLEALVAKQDAIIVELRADKTQRAAIARQAAQGQEKTNNQLQRVARGVVRANG